MDGKGGAAAFSGGGSTDQVAKQVANAMSQPVQESFKNCFETLLLPAFEASTRAMFTQINSTFQQGKKEEERAQAKINRDTRQKQEAMLSDITGMFNKVMQSTNELQTEVSVLRNQNNQLQLQLRQMGSMQAKVISNCLSNSFIYLTI
jgi:hypothetical protein